MDDLSSKLSSILSDPESIAQLSSLASMLGEESPGVHKEEPAMPKLPDGLNMGTITKLMPLIGELSKEDDTTRLLKAMRPFLSEKRKNKLDEAEKLLKMMKLLPLLKDFSIF